MELSGHCDVLVLVGPGQGPGPSESCGTLMLRRAPVGGSSPGTCCRNPKVISTPRSGQPGHCDVAVLDRPGPPARPCESFGTRMLRRAPREGRRREHFVGSHCLVRPGRAAVGACRRPAGSVRVSGAKDPARAPG